MAHRPERLTQKIRHEVSQLILFEMSDPRIQGVTVTRVTLTRDLGLARIYYEVTDRSQKKLIQEALKEATGFIRRSLSSRLKLRLMPQIEFFYDETSEEVQKVEQLFSKL